MPIKTKQNHKIQVTVKSGTPSYLNGTRRWRHRSCWPPTMLLLDYLKWHEFIPLTACKQNSLQEIPTVETIHHQRYWTVDLKWIERSNVDRRGPLTEEVDQEPAIGQPTSRSAEEGTAIWEVDRETETGDETTRIGVGVSEVEDNRGSFALTENRVRKKVQRQQWKKQEEGEGEKRVRDHSGSSGWEVLSRALGSTAFPVYF